MHRRVRRLAAALTLGAGLLAGCGGADVEEPDSGTEVDGGGDYDPDDLDEREEND